MEGGVRAGRTAGGAAVGRAGDRQDDADGALASEVHKEGATVVYGRGDEDLGVPYQPWIEALRQLVVTAPQDVLVGHVAESGGHLARLVPALTSGVELTPSGGDGNSERFVGETACRPLGACVPTMWWPSSSKRPATCTPVPWSRDAAAAS